MLKRLRDAINVLLGRQQALPPARPGSNGGGAAVAFRARLMGKDRIVRYIGPHGPNHVRVEEVDRENGMCVGLITEADVHPEDRPVFRQLKG